jgi:hypothetical protein
MSAVVASGIWGSSLMQEDKMPEKRSRNSNKK